MNDSLSKEGSWLVLQGKIPISGCYYILILQQQHFQYKKKNKSSMLYLLKSEKVKLLGLGLYG